jgi:hypothetical protein
MTIDQDYPESGASGNPYGAGPSNELSREMMRRQEEQDFIDEEMNFARQGSIDTVDMGNFPPT